MNVRRLYLGIGFAALFACATAVAGLAQVGPPPPPPGATALPSPGASPSALPRRGHRTRPAASSTPGAGPSDTPEPPQFTTLDGTWEIESQPLLQRLADYSYMTIVANGATLTGQWVHGSKKVGSPMTGTFDGRLISMSVTLPNGTTGTFNGYVENFDNMVGIYRASASDPGLAFTGEHRKRQRDRDTDSK